MGEGDSIGKRITKMKFTARALRWILRSIAALALLRPPGRYYLHRTWDEEPPQDADWLIPRLNRGHK